MLSPADRNGARKTETNKHKTQTSLGAMWHKKKRGSGTTAKPETFARKTTQCSLQFHKKAQSGIPLTKTLKAWALYLDTR